MTKKGYKQTLEHRQKKGDALRGYHHTEEAKKKDSEAHMGFKNFMYGKCHSEETKKVMSEQKLGIKNPRYGNHTVLSEEHKKNISLALQEKIRTEEHCKHISEAKKARHWHPLSETRRKWSVMRKGMLRTKETKQKISGPVSGPHHDCGGHYTAGELEGDS